MKKVVIIIFILLVVSSCKKTKVTTKFNTDGSCYRTQEITNHKNNFESKNLYFPIDSTWNVTIEKDSANDNFKLNANKIFLSAEAINKEYQNIDNKFSILNREISFKRNFRWFYTYFKYSEKLGKVFNGPGIEDYLSKEQLDAIYADSDDSVDSLEDIFETYYSDCIVADFYFILEKAIRESSYSEIEIENILNTRDKFDLMVKNDTLSTPEETSEFLSYIAEISGVNQLINLSGSVAFKKLDKKIELTGDLFIDEICNEVEIPGLVLKSNADELIANKASWDIRLDKLLSNDYKMILESRIINKWTFYVSFFIILIAGILGIIRLKSIKH